METNKNMIKIACISAVFILLGFTQCTKPETDDDFPAGDPPPVEGGFVNSSEIAAESLVAHFPFDGNVNDVKNAISGGVASGTTSFVEGRKGQAYQGSNNGFIAYASTGPVATLTSFTISLWINTAKHPAGSAQGIFTLAKEDGSFWGNFFMLVEGTDAPDNKMFMKFHFEKNTAKFVEHWVEPGGDFRADDMYNGWRHVALSYDAGTSKVAWYINGQKKTLPAGVEDRKADDTTPLGGLNFKNPTKFVIGGMQNHLGTPFNSPESWMANYTGKLDEFRIYNKALTGQEINAIQTLERQGR